ncbi:MAG: hypothetical protein AAGA80_06125 [Cyanobacteria bacterium P01_F01_bin.143]
MKVKYIAMLLAVSLLSVGVVSCGNSADSNSEIKQENPCAGKKENPCAGKENPCAGKENPCAGK